ncbi:hypothetical protein D3C86_2053140 [compost metagenome]
MVGIDGPGIGIVGGQAQVLEIIRRREAAGGAETVGGFLVIFGADHGVDEALAEECLFVIQHSIVGLANNAVEARR